MVLAEEVFQLAFGLQLHDQLAKQSIRPSEPRAGVIGRIVLMERLVHEARASVRITKRLYAIPDLLLVVGSRSTHDQAHRPDIVETDMRTADALAGLSLEEVRIGRTQHQAAGILVNRVFP
mgnify:FL=1